MRKTNSNVVPSHTACAHTGNDIHAACIINNTSDDTIAHSHCVVNNVIDVAGTISDINIATKIIYDAITFNDFDSGTCGWLMIKTYY